MTAPALQRVLTEDETLHHHEQGYVPVKVLSAQECARYRQLILDMLPRDLTIPAHWGVNAGRIKPYHEDKRRASTRPSCCPCCATSASTAAVQLLGDHRLRAFDASSASPSVTTPPGTPLSQTPHLDCSVSRRSPSSSPRRRCRSGLLLLH